MRNRKGKKDQREGGERGVRCGRKELVDEWRSGSRRTRIK